MVLKLLSAHIENFKGVKALDITFGHKTRIMGANATGKTTVFDAITWLLFNKNSLGAEKFELRPLDADGKTVNFVDILVNAEFEKDGEQFTLLKRQKQNWVKHRGSEEAEFQGNVNEYEINGYPKSEKEFKAYIAEVMDEELFKLLSNPTYFTSLPWKKQRETLMKLVQTESDYELAERLGCFAEILGELKVAGTDDIAKKWQKTQKELKARQTEIPVRIDELEKQKVEYDESALCLQKIALEEKLSTLAGTEQQRAYEALSIVKAKRDAIKLEKDNEKTRTVNKISMQVAEIESNLNKAKAEVEKHEYAVQARKEALAVAKSELEALGKKYFTRKDEEYTPKTQNMGSNSNVCPICGQIYPKEKIDALKRENERLEKEACEKFYAEKEADLKRLVEQGNNYQTRVKSYEAEIKAAQDAAEDADTRRKGLKTDLAIAQGSLEYEQGRAVDYGSEYEQLTGEIDFLNQRIKDTEVDQATVEKETREATAELEEVKAKLSQANNNVNIDERIGDLKEELRNVAQKVADCEKILFVLDKFVRAKMDNVSDKINSCFELINVRLFKPLINGGIEECCDITINGVPFASLNNGARIVGGLDLIRTLGKIYGTQGFVFIDNAESVNDFNVPEMDEQLIELVVTADKTMKVEV